MEAKKSFGQNFLVDESIIEKMIKSADLKKGESVLEIGPGHGAITDELIKTGTKVTAIEADRDLITGLEEKFGDKIDLLEGNALKTDLSLKDMDYTLVANLPYNIASHVLRKFLSTKPRPKRMVVMVQREVADRIVAEPPDMGILSVACQLYAKCKKVTNVYPSAFNPKPKVDSAIVRLDTGTVLMTSGVEEQIISLAKTGFSSRRKQLRRNLIDAKIINKAVVDEIFNKAKLDPKIRAQNLTISDWITLHNLLNNS